MTGNEDPLTPQEEEVRRLLAAARHAGPTPPEVVARLDAVLDELGGEPSRAAPVVDLARRRRRVASLLVAAAAVVVVGIGLGQVLSPQGGGDAAQSGAATSAEDHGQGPAQPRSAQPKSQAGEAESAPVESAPLSDAAKLRVVRPDELTDDITAARQAAGNSADFSYKQQSANGAAGALCSADSWGQGRFVLVRYGKTPAVLVFRRPMGDTQVVDLFLCGSEQPERSVTLPAP
jgi:hypothetical protein